MAKPPPRLHVAPDPRLADGGALPVDGARWHYLHTVLRLGDGAEVLLFDGATGEWAGHIADAGRRAGMVRVKGQTRTFAPAPDVSLLFAPLRKEPTELVLQKGTELGVRTFCPVITARTVRQKNAGRDDRHRAIVVEAAEQCERLDLPALMPPAPLGDALGALPAGTRIMFCDEAGDDPAARWGGGGGRGLPAPKALSRHEGSDGASWAILIGPEGGFTPEERDALRARPDTVAVSLGPRILKAETAAIAAVTLWQATLGDLI